MVLEILSDESFTNTSKIERTGVHCGLTFCSWADFIRALEHIVPHSFGWAPSDQLPDPASNGAPAPAITPRAITNQPPPVSYW